MKRLEDHRKLTGLMAVLVFALFGISLLLVLLTGAKVCRDLTRRGGEETGARTVRDYLYTRARQGENLRVEDFGGCDALVTEETVAGVTYLTRVYCYEGWLRELFCAGDAQVSPEDGEKLLEADYLKLSLEGDLLRARTDPEEPALILYLRTGQEVGP